MSPFVAELLFDELFIGIAQAFFALFVVAVTLPLSAFWPRIHYDRLLFRFALFNLFLFGWSIPGNALWLYFTWDRFAVLDDSPVWSPFIPFGRAMLNHAGGGRSGWHLSHGTTIFQLKWIWAATAVPVWLFAIATLCIYIRVCAAKPVCLLY